MPLKISFVISIFVISSLAYAVEFRGSATERFEGVYSKKKALAAVDKARSKACTNAFNKFVKGMEESKRMIFEGIKDQIYNNLSEYMTCSVVVEENINKKENIPLTKNPTNVGLILIKIIEVIV